MTTPTPNGIEIVKASGEKENFDGDKLHASIERAGAESGIIEKVYGAVTRTMRPGVSSETILGRTFHRLQTAENILWK